MAPLWLTVVAWLYLAVCFGCAGVIAYDITVNRRRQPMGVMNFVFPITALYLGPLALWFYWRWGRAARTLPPMSANPAVKSPAPVAASAGNSMHAHQHAHHGMTAAAGRTSGAGNGAQPAERGTAMVGHDLHRGEPLRLWMRPRRRDLRVRDLRAGPHDRRRHAGRRIRRRLHSRSRVRHHLPVLRDCADARRWCCSPRRITSCPARPPSGSLCRSA
jgi:hypothetical protein